MRLRFSSVRHAAAAALAIALASRPSGAQKLSELSAGARVRVSADRATNTGIEHYRKVGALVGADTGHLFIRTDADVSSLPDTIALFGVRKLEIFRGMRSRREMIFTGAALGGVVGVATWLIGRRVVGGDDTVTEFDSNLNATDRRSNTERVRLAIPFMILGGGLIGALIGPEHWERIPVPSSVFPEAR